MAKIYKNPKEPPMFLVKFLPGWMGNYRVCIINVKTQKYKEVTVTALNSKQDTLGELCAQVGDVLLEFMK